MLHIDAEALAGHALGEPLDREDNGHLAICQQCRDELARMLR